MKLRYFIPSLMAVLAMLVSCSEDNTPTLLSEVQVSSSYVALPEAGGSTSITVTAADSWSISEASVPAWLTVSPMSGSAGASTLTFSAGTATESQTGEVLLNCGGKVQRINVLQYAEVTDPVILTVAEAVALIKANAQGDKAVYVKGIVCRIQEISPSYGNATYFISDDGTFGDGNWLEIYRGKWLNGANFTKGDEFSVGDEMVISGVLIDYNGTPETNQGTSEVISISKSLLKCDSLTVNGVIESTLPVEGGDIVANLTCKGNGVAVEVPAEAQSWLGVVATTVGDTPTVTLHAQPNAGGDRTTTVTFKTTDGQKDYTAQATINQKGAIIDANVSEFLAAEVGETQYRVKGVIQSVANPTYGNIYLKDFSGETYVYGIGSKGDFEAAGLKEGDIVTLVGKRGEYKGSAQMTGAQLEEVISVTDISIADFLTMPDDKNTWYKVTGTISSLLGSNGKENDYGNLYITDGTHELYVYGTYPGWGATGDARKFFIAENDIEVGDQITIIGYKDTYKELVELCGGVCFGFRKANAE